MLTCLLMSVALTEYWYVRFPGPPISVSVSDGIMWHGMYLEFNCSGLLVLQMIEMKALTETSLKHGSLVDQNKYCPDPAAPEFIGFLAQLISISPQMHTVVLDFSTYSLKGI